MIKKFIHNYIVFAFSIHSNYTINRNNFPVFLALRSFCIQKPPFVKKKNIPSLSIFPQQIPQATHGLERISDSVTWRNEGYRKPPGYHWNRCLTVMSGFSGWTNALNPIQCKLISARLKFPMTSAPRKLPHKSAVMVRFRTLNSLLMLTRLQAGFCWLIIHHDLSQRRHLLCRSAFSLHRAGVRNNHTPKPPPVFRRISAPVPAKMVAFHGIYAQDLIERFSLVLADWVWIRLLVS